MKKTIEKHSFHTKNFMTREEALNIIGICVTMARVDLEFSQDEKHLLHELCNSISISDKEKGQMKSISGSLSEMVQRVENEDSKNTLVELLSKKLPFKC